MKEAALPLAERIRDIHQPEPHFWWPPAPGWWLVAALLLLLGVLAILRHRRRTALRRAALAELRGLRRARLDDRQLAVSLEMLLRRVAVARLSRREVATLHGEAWLALLDRLGDTREFGEGAGRVLLRAPWEPSTSFDREALFDLVERWLERAA